MGRILVGWFVGLVVGVFVAAFIAHFFHLTDNQATYTGLISGGAFTLIGIGVAMGFGK